MIRLSEYPQLRLIAWNRPQDEFIDEELALALYERNWSCVDTNALEPQETTLVNRLAEQYGNGCFAAI